MFFFFLFSCKLCTYDEFVYDDLIFFSHPNVFRVSFPESSSKDSSLRVNANFVYDEFVSNSILHSSLFLLEWKKRLLLERVRAKKRNAVFWETCTCLILIH
jgi:hypothetical protein